MPDVQVRFVDEDGDRATHSYNMSDVWANYIQPQLDNNIDELCDALEGVSKARIDRVGITRTLVVTDTATQNNPYDIRDKLVATFKTLSGTIRLSIPAPLESVLIASDFATRAIPAIDALADACIGYVRNQYGEFASELLTVVRQHVSRKK